MLFIALFFLFCVLLCRPEWTTNYLPIQGTVLPIRDESGGNLIEECIIIPLYMTTIGGTTGAGHGLGYTKNSAFLSKPFYYFKNDTFSPKNGKSYGIFFLIGSSWVGKSTEIIGLLVISYSFQPKMIWAVRSLDDFTKHYSLKPFLHGEIQKNEILMNFLSKKGLDDFHLNQIGEEFPQLRFPTVVPIEIRLTKEEKQAIEEYVKHGRDTVSKTLPILKGR